MIRPAVTLLAALTVITGVAYPLAITAVATAIGPRMELGSVGQQFTRAEFFHGRPSAIEPPYDALKSAASNLGPTNPKLAAVVAERTAALRAKNPGAGDGVPDDLVTASASGLDPHLSVAAAKYQVLRVAHARGLEPAALSARIDEMTESRWLGIFGEPRVNVVRLNATLARDGHGQ